MLDLSAIDEARRPEIANVLSEVFGRDGATSVRSVVGGASPASLFRVETSSGPHLLRIEGDMGALRNPHQYECMAIAADAGIAPPIRYVDGDAGVLLVPFISQRPITDLPGGPPAVAAETATLLRRLHEVGEFPAIGDQVANTRALLASLSATGRVAPGLLDRHVDALDQLAAAYPWDPATFRPAHNDPNPSNVLYDGDRLWLIDWETASRNDPFVDLAVATNSHEPEDLSEVVLRTWRGGEPSELDRARLGLMRAFVRLFAGCILLTVVVDPEAPAHDDLAALTPDQLRSEVMAGRLKIGAPATTIAYAKLMLQAFLDMCTSPQASAWRDIAAAT